MKKDWDYNKIMSDRKLFNETVYTPLTEAIKILKERQKDKKLVAKIEKLLNGDVPEPLRKLDKYGISRKQVATPNNDTRWFLKLTKEFKLKPLFSEYLDDKFTSNNDFKHSLGMIYIDNGINKNGDNKVEKIRIVDFNKYNGKKIKDVKTLWGENLIDFHHSLFKKFKLDNKNIVFHNDSNWLQRKGEKANKYYKNDLLLNVSHCILFENFLITGGDRDFVEKILLPSINKIVDKLGVKPLIVPIPPMDIEEDVFWYFYDKKIKNYIIKVN